MIGWRTSRQGLQITRTVRLRREVHAAQEVLEARVGARGRTGRLNRRLLRLASRSHFT